LVLISFFGLHKTSSWNVWCIKKAKLFGHVWGIQVKFFCTPKSLPAPIPMNMTTKKIMKAGGKDNQKNCLESKRCFENRGCASATGSLAIFKGIVDSCLAGCLRASSHTCLPMEHTWLGSLVLTSITACPFCFAKC